MDELQAIRNATVLLAMAEENCHGEEEPDVVLTIEELRALLARATQSHD